MFRRLLFTVMPVNSCERSSVRGTIYSINALPVVFFFAKALLYPVEYAYSFVAFGLNIETPFLTSQCISHLCAPRLIVIGLVVCMKTRGGGNAEIIRVYKDF